MTTEREFDYMFKIILLGDIGSGKATLMLRHRDGMFVEENANKEGTNFLERYFKDINVNEYKVRLEVYYPYFFYTRFLYQTNTFYRKVHGVICCCGLGPVLNDPRVRLLENIPLWQTEIERYCYAESIGHLEKVLVATKSDLLIEPARITSMQPSNINPNVFSLPVHIVENIISFLPARDVARCCRINKMWQKSTNNEDLWQSLFTNDFREIKLKTRSHPTWKLEYMNIASNCIYISDIKKISEKLQIPYYVTSAKTGENVDKLFYDMAANLVAKTKAGIEFFPKPVIIPEIENNKDNFFVGMFKKWGLL